MANYEKITVRVRPFVKDELKALRRETAERMGIPLPNQDDLVAALIHDATVARLASALRGYWRDVRPWEDEDDS